LSQASVLDNFGLKSILPKSIRREMFKKHQLLAENRTAPKSPMREEQDGPCHIPLLAQALPRPGFTPGEGILAFIPFLLLSNGKEYIPGFSRNQRGIYVLKPPKTIRTVLISR